MVGYGIGAKPAWASLSSQAAAVAVARVTRTRHGDEGDRIP